MMEPSRARTAEEAGMAAAVNREGFTLAEWVHHFRAGVVAEAGLLGATETTGRTVNWIAGRCRSC